jgi:hypothetical protein
MIIIATITGIVLGLALGIALWHAFKTNEPGPNDL